MEETEEKNVNGEQSSTTEEVGGTLEKPAEKSKKPRKPRKQKGANPPPEIICSRPGINVPREEGIGN